MQSLRNTYQNVASSFGQMNSRIKATFTRSPKSADDSFGMGSAYQATKPTNNPYYKDILSSIKAKVVTKATAKGVAIGIAVSGVVGGAIAAGVLHVQLVAAFASLPAAMAALGAAIGAISPVGWVFIGIASALAIGFAGYAGYKYYQNYKLDKEIKLAKAENQALIYQAQTASI